MPFKLRRHRETRQSRASEGLQVAPLLRNCLKHPGVGQGRWTGPDRRDYPSRPVANWGTRWNRRASRCHAGMELHGGDEMSKYDTYRAARPSLRELHPDLAPALDQLTIDQDRHFEIVKLLLGPNGPGVLAPLFPVDSAGEPRRVVSKGQPNFAPPTGR